MPINATVKLCGAKARQNNHQPCRQPGMLTNGRCRLHGGKSTGAKTKEGLKKIAKTSYKHGRYTTEALAERKQFREMVYWCKKDLEETSYEY